MNISLASYTVAKIRIFQMYYTVNFSWNIEPSPFNILLQTTVLEIYRTFVVKIVNFRHRLSVVSCNVTKSR
jgi:hypothetical protein